MWAAAAAGPAVAAGFYALDELRTVAANGLGFEVRTAKSFGRSQPLATVTARAGAVIG